MVKTRSCGRRWTSLARPFLSVTNPNHPNHGPTNGRIDEIWCVQVWSFAPESAQIELTELKGSGRGGCFRVVSVDFRVGCNRGGRVWFFMVFPPHSQADCKLTRTSKRNKRASDPVCCSACFGSSKDSLVQRTRFRSSCSTDSTTHVDRL